MDYLTHVFLEGDEALKLMRETSEIKWCPLEGSKIADFYKDKNVFVTGATGFLGKLLVEKLLRACPEVRAVYILVRPKKGEDEHNRVDKLYSDQIFGPLAKIFPKFQHKINIIKGDVSLPNLGLAPSSVTQLVDEINVIFHIAATVRFDENLNVATAINVRGTRDLLDIAKQCKHLESFVHVSTAYANCNQKEIDEKFYKPKITAEELIETVERTPEKALLQNTNKIMEGWPNTYTFTKAIAEDAVAQYYGQGLPVCVVRPAIVIATAREPLRSWIDNLYGATGIVIGTGTGLLHTVHCDGTKTAEVVPGDFVINHMIAASYQTATEKNSAHVPIYNYVSSVENRQNWNEFMAFCKRHGLGVPSIRSVWFSALTLNKFLWVHYLYTIFVHFLPAILMDFGMVLARQKPIMVKIYKKIMKFESVISHFCANEWTFSNDNTQTLWRNLSSPDQKMFPFSMKELNWNEYHRTHLIGLRTYIVKDNDSTIPQARIKWTRLYIAHHVLKHLLYFVILYVVYAIFVKLTT